MKKIIIMTGSVSGASASSSKAALLASDQLKIKYPDSSIEYIDLNESEFGGVGLTSKTFDAYFANSVEWINKLKEIDILVFSTSMTNFGYTATVKNFIDKICLAKEAFKYKYDGSGLSEGLITKPKVILITSQGAPKGWYPFGDHTIQLTGTFKFLGMTVLDPVIIAGTKTPASKGKTADDFANEAKGTIQDRINSL